MQEDGHASVIAARLEPGDVPENKAADVLAQALMAPLLTRSRASTGRVNLSAETAGLLVVNADAVNRLNRLDESLTLGTLPSFVPVRAREMVATIKVIPFAVPGAVLEVAAALARQEQPLLALHPFQPLKVGLVLTELPGLKEKVLEGTVEATRERRRGAVRHHAAAGALPPRGPRPSPTRSSGSGGRVRRCCWSRARRRWWTGAMWVRPGIVRAGGVIDHFGMPVDPGNLICLGHIDSIPIAGAARLRAFAQAQRHRLGAAAALRRIGGAADRRHGHGRGRAAERDPDPAAAPRGSRGRAGAGARAAPCAAGGGAGAGGRAVAPHGTR